MLFLNMARLKMWAMKGVILFLSAGNNIFISTNGNSSIYIEKGMKKNSELLFSFIMIAGIIVLLFACERLEVNRTIKIETQSVTDITTDSASVLGEIIDLGEDGVTEYGHCWSTHEIPTISDSSINLGDTNSRGAFTSPLVGLMPYTTYYIRAFATDKQGTTYGNQIEFTKSVFSDSRDDYNYKWVSIGSQVWMAENLAYLPAVCSADSGSRDTPCYYVFDYSGNNITEAKATANYSTYGVLYNWPAAMKGAAGNDNNPSGVQGICPDGWHMPSDAEWKQLEMYLGMDSVELNFGEFRGTNEGGKLKEAGNVHWNEPNSGADNSSGFTALPGGWRSWEGDLHDLRDIGCWWSVTEYDYSSVYKRALANDEARIERDNYYKDCAFSVRCVRDN
jgi:uncharacterized protein (TIGR02145 family)